MPIVGVQATEAQQVVLSLNRDVPGPEVNRWVTASFNFGNWMDIAEFGKVLRESVPPASLRFPGGNVGDDQDLSPPVLDIFKTNLELLQANVPLIIQTRLFQGKGGEPVKNSPEDAAEAVKLARERKLKVAYWQIGNEPDLYSKNRGDARWTPEYYCDVFRAQAAAIRAFDPDAKFAGPGVSGGVPDSAHYLNRFVKACGDVVDMLTWHIYPTAGRGSEEEALASVSEPGYWFDLHRKTWADPAANPLGFSRKIKFAMTEYGLSWNTGNATYLADMPAAMFAAETALRMARAGMDAAYYFAYQGVGFHGLLDQSGIAQPTFYAFKLINDLKGRFIETQSSDKGVWVTTVQEGKKISLILMNTHKEERRVQTALPGLRLVRGLWFDQETVDKDAPPRKYKPSPILGLPARSITRLDYVAK